ncbi:MAG: ferredoxin [Gracilibacteraceae bacterium]|jgi:NAD-dependent dihydropyrimidine dehydrogenase PreA subunit|nr:ferredoxin [Gracilibacteraceae bacterium]
MIANYGCEDGSGVYYIRIDTGKCGDCQLRGCVGGCPRELFVIEEDDWGDEMAVVREDRRRTLQAACAACKPQDRPPDPLPCQSACGRQAIEHSW